MSESSNPILATTKPSATKPVELDVQGILESVSSDLSKIDSAYLNYVSATKTAESEQRKITASKVQAIEDAASAETIVTAATQNAALRTQSLKNQALDAAGGSPAYLDLLSKQRYYGQEVQDLQDQQDANMNKERTGVFLIDGFINMFANARTGMQLAIAKDKQAEVTKQLANINANVLGTNAVIKDTEEALTKEAIAANAQKIAALAQKDVQDAKMQGLFNNSAALGQLAQATMSQLKSRMDGISAVNQALDRAGNQELRTIQLEQAKTNLESSRLALNAQKNTTVSTIDVTNTRNVETTKELQDAATTRIASINAVKRELAYLGAAVPDDAYIRTQLESPDVNVRRPWVDLASTGMIRKGDPGTQGEGYSSPVEALQITEQFGGKSTAFTKAAALRVQKAKDILDKQREDQAKSPMGAPKLTAEQVKAQQAEDINFINNYIRNELAAESKNITKASVFAAPPLQALTQVIADKSRPNKLFEIMQMNGINDSSPEVVIKEAVNLVRAKVLTKAQAVKDIDHIYTAAVAHTNEFQGGPTRIGVKSLEKYQVILKPSDIYPEAGNAITDYSVISKIGTGYSGAVNITGAKELTKATRYDLTNESDIDKLFLRAYRASMLVLPKSAEAKQGK